MNGSDFLLYLVFTVWRYNILLDVVLLSRLFLIGIIRNIHFYPLLSRLVSNFLYFRYLPGKRRIMRMSHPVEVRNGLLGLV